MRVETQRRVDALAPLSEEVVEQPDVVTAGDLLRLMVRAEQEELLRMRDEEGLPDSIVRPAQLALDMRHQALGQKKPGT